jgi:hypothetical protein
MRFFDPKRAGPAKDLFFRWEVVDFCSKNAENRPDILKKGIFGIQQVLF